MKLADDLTAGPAAGNKKVRPRIAGLPYFEN
jgi:hypothetical protein